jgi:hypothetical protein
MVITDSQNQSRFDTLPTFNDKIAKGGKKNG